MNDSLKALAEKVERDKIRRCRLTDTHRAGMTFLRDCGIHSSDINAYADTTDLPDGGDVRDPDNNVHMVFEVDLGLGETIVLRQWPGEGVPSWEGFDVDNATALLGVVDEIRADIAAHPKPPGPGWIIET